MDQQTDIKNWFDNTYRTKGFRYLRPPEAYEIFVSLLAPESGTKHLDVACGLGLLLKELDRKGVMVFGIDISTEAVNQSKRYCPAAQVEEGNAEDLPYPDNMFDSLTCIGSLERMVNRRIALKEQLRVVKKNGRFCYMVRNSEHFTWKYFLKPLGLENSNGHQDALNLTQWQKLFRENGFNVDAIYPDHWPYFRIMKTLQPWKKINTGKLRKFPFDINRAYEFIFLLSKNG